MSQENVEVAKHIVDLANARDVDGNVSQIHEIRVLEQMGYA